MANQVEIMSPLRLSSYRDEKTNNQIFQWVVGEYEASQLAKWEDVLDGSDAITQDIVNIELIKSMYFVVTKNTTTGNSELNTGASPTGSTQTNPPTLTNGGDCIYGGDLVPFTLTEDIWNLNSCHIYKNGTMLTKDIEVFFVDENVIRLLNRLQVNDIITIEQIVGV